MWLGPASNRTWWDNIPEDKISQDLIGNHDGRKVRDVY